MTGESSVGPCARQAHSPDSEFNTSLQQLAHSFDSGQMPLVPTFLERGTMLLGRTSLRFLQLSTGRVRAATQEPSVDEETRFSRCFLCNCSSASELSPGMCSPKAGWSLYRGRKKICYSEAARKPNLYHLFYSQMSTDTNKYSLAGLLKNPINVYLISDFLLSLPSSPSPSAFDKPGGPGPMQDKCPTF